MSATARTGPRRGFSSHAYHLTHVENWPSIAHHGLLSTSALLTLAGLDGNDRRQLEFRHRPMPVTLPNGVILNDQRPMPPAALRRCLVDGTTPEEWYALLNSRVFFWLDPERLNRQLRAGGLVPRAVLVIDPRQLLARHAQAASVSPINSGAALRRPAVRGKATFVPYDEWRHTGWRSESTTAASPTRPQSHAPVELSLDGAVRDILEFVLDVRSLEAGESFAL